MRISRIPLATASSTTNWIAGLSTIGIISFGMAFVYGRKREPKPAAGMTAFIFGCEEGASPINPCPRNRGTTVRAKAIKRAPHAAPNPALRRRACRLEETMKVHHIAPHFHPERGGVEWNVLGLGRYLVDRGHEVVVHTSSRGIRGETFPAIGTIDGIAIRRYRPAIHLGYYATVFRSDVRGADIVHLHGYGFLTNARAAPGLHRTVPFVYSLHHGVSQPPPSVAAALKWKAYYALQGRATLRRAAAIISGSVPDRDWLASRGFPLERVHVVPTGLDPAAFRPGSPERARSRFRLDHYILFLGRGGPAPRQRWRRRLALCVVRCGRAVEGHPTNHREPHGGRGDRPCGARQSLLEVQMGNPRASGGNHLRGRCPLAKLNRRNNRTGSPDSAGLPARNPGRIKARRWVHRPVRGCIVLHTDLFEPWPIGRPMFEARVLRALGRGVTGFSGIKTRRIPL